MPKKFDCPSCGAPLDYDGGTDYTIRCPFCNNSVIVPEELRPEPVRHIQMTTVQSQNTGARLTCVIVAIAVAILLIGIIPVALMLNRTAKLAADTQDWQISVPMVINSTEVVGPTDTQPDTPTPGFANVTLQYGSKGIGPGLLNDTRVIAVDSNGIIYLGDYTGGRVQALDSTGKFITQWSVGDSQTLIFALTTDRKGTVYVVANHGIQLFEGATGKFISEIQYPDKGFSDAFIAPDGSLVTTIYTGEDNIIRFDAKGKVNQTIRDVFSSQTGMNEMEMKVAVDGLGNIYALGAFNNAVFKYSPQGKFITQFGSSGDEPGQFRAVEDIAVDGQGRVYVSDIKGVQVFDPSGRYLATIGVEKGVPFGIVFSDQDELFVTTRDVVYKYALNQ
jgi:outer membrane protein assembly factor BamB